MIAEAKRPLWWHYPPGLILLFILIWALILLLQGTTGGWINAAVNQPAAETFGETTFNGRLFSFTHSTAYHTVVHEPEAAGQYEERVTISASKPYARQVSVSIRRMNERLAGVPDVRKRRLESADYAESTATLAGRPALRFVRTNRGYEEVLFIARTGDTFVALAIVTPDPGKRETAAAEFATLAASFVLQ